MLYRVVLNNGRTGPEDGALLCVAQQQVKYSRTQAFGGSRTVIEHSYQLQDAMQQYYCTSICPTIAIATKNTNKIINPLSKIPRQLCRTSN